MVHRDVETELAVILVCSHKGSTLRDAPAARVDALGPVVAVVEQGATVCHLHACVQKAMNGSFHMMVLSSLWRASVLRRDRKMCCLHGGATKKEARHIANGGGSECPSQRHEVQKRARQTVRT